MLQSYARDSLELGSLASSSPGATTSTSSTSSRSGISSSRKLSLEAEDPLDGQVAVAAGRPSPHARSFSVSSTLDFTANLFPLSSSTNGGQYAPIGVPANGPNGQATLGGGSLEKHKHLTYLTGVSLVVGLMIGSGIFSAPKQVNVNAGSPGASLIVWAVAGVLVWTGAACYAELGSAIPLNGGAQVYLAKIFGELAGFLYTWSAVLLLKPGSLAVMSLIMGEYLVRSAIGAEAENVSPWINKVMAIVGLIAVTSANCISTKFGTRMSDILLFLKLFTLLGVTVTGIVVAVTGLSASGKSSTDWKTRGWFEGTSTSASSWAVAVYAGLWAFDGWDNTNYIVGEFKHPTRDLPRVIHTAMPLVLISYIMANLAYFFVLPFSVINSSNTVAVMFGNKVFGPIGSLVLALVVSASCFGALNASTITSGRLTYTAGKEGYIPAIFGKVGFGGGQEPSINAVRTRNWAFKYIVRVIGDEDTGLFYTPMNALALNFVLTTGYIIVGEFSTLITFYGVAGYTFYFLTVLGLIVLRVREPNLERPYRTWITTPIIFCCVSLFLLSRAVFAEPLQTIIVILFVASGIPVYYWRFRRKDQVRRRGRSESVAEWWKVWKRLRS